MSFLRLGSPGFGAVVDDGIIDLTAMLPGRPRCLRTAIAGGQLASAMEYVEGRAPELSSTDVIFLPPITAPAKIFCVGLN